MLHQLRPMLCSAVETCHRAQEFWMLLLSTDCVYEHRLCEEGIWQKQTQTKLLVHHGHPSFWSKSLSYVFIWPCNYTVYSQRVKSLQNQIFTIPHSSIRPTEVLNLPP
jgi:hypothetical protein